VLSDGTKSVSLFKSAEKASVCEVVNNIHLLGLRPGLTQRGVGFQMNQESSDSVSAVSFGGGGRCGTGRHIAAAERYRNADIAYWQGCSIGGFIAVLMANGYSESEMIEAMYDLWHPSLGSAIRAITPRAVNVFKLLRGDLNEFSKLGANLGLLKQRDHVRKWARQRKLKWNNAKLVLLDLLTGELYIADGDSGIDVEDGLSGTMAVPGVFAPVACVDGKGKRHLFVDGGMRHIHPHVDGHKTAIVKCLSFPFRDRLFKDEAGDVSLDISVVPGLNVLLPPPRDEIKRQVREAHQRLLEMTD
jgi:Patatin-like phospholipase